MNNELISEIKIRMLKAAKTGMYEKEAREIADRCADEALDSAIFAVSNMTDNEQRHRSIIEQIFKAIEMRMKTPRNGKNRRNI